MSWRVVYVKSRSEKKVATELLMRKIEAYVPIQKTLKQWSDRKKMIDLPLINGYVFVKVDDVNREQVLRNSSILNFVRFNGADALVKDEEIESLKQIVKLGYNTQIEPINKNIKSGDIVTITDGPLKGVSGVISSSTDNHFFEIHLESIGQVIKAKLPIEIIQLLSN